MSKSIRRQIRWFSYPGSTSSIARQEFEQLPNHGKAALIEALRRYQRGAERRAEIKRLVHPSGYPALAELRVQVGHDPFRILFFQDTPVHTVIVLAVYKNQQKLPKHDLDLALDRMKTWRRRRAF